MKILISGIAGRMGQELLKEIEESDDFIACAGYDKIKCNNRIPVYDNIEKIKEKPDVIIDFSNPSATFNILKYAKENIIPIVIATTGFNDSETKIINEEYAKLIPIFKSNNMSYEISLMSEIISNLATKLKEADIEIIETHHRNKIDSPSGTALMLADSINETLGNKLEYVYDRHDKKNKRSNTEIGIHSVRGGTEVGKHSIIFFSEDESLEITHNVTSRRIFARGALKAAKYIINKKSGMYNMKDLLKEEEKYEK